MGMIKRAPAWGRHMGLPKQGHVARALTWADTWVCPYQISWFTAISCWKRQIILISFKAVEFKNWWLQLLFIHIHQIKKVKFCKLEYWYYQSD